MSLPFSKGMNFSKWFEAPSPQAIVFSKITEQDFIKMLEGAKSVQVVEDSSVGPGGCVIETDFGEIDARISSQLAELESKILEISPIRTRVRPAASRETK
jgi:hypothetical protein